MSIKIQCDYVDVYGTEWAGNTGWNTGWAF